ncbi:hypothetical protein H2200_005957 [Cladophialophora chaetospira]|uniref:Uncharacterized protein n=1 Tax=Cladophialophora chaetospira TaxID=386627 RepID=A0AA39CIN6_9EURO|nr:hypothetical protein H2200_005957 [Cladophialophora chaetospira]
MPFIQPPPWKEETYSTPLYYPLNTPIALEWTDAPDDAFLLLLWDKDDDNVECAALTMGGGTYCTVLGDLYTTLSPSNLTIPPSDDMNAIKYYYIFMVDKSNQSSVFSTVNFHLFDDSPTSTQSLCITTASTSTTSSTDAITVSPITIDASSGNQSTQHAVTTIFTFDGSTSCSSSSIPTRTVFGIIVGVVMYFLLIVIIIAYSLWRWKWKVRTVRREPEARTETTVIASPSSVQEVSTSIPVESNPGALTLEELDPQPTNRWRHELSAATAAREQTLNFDEVYPIPVSTASEYRGYHRNQTQ